MAEQPKGKPVPVVYGTSRIAQAVVWYGDFRWPPARTRDDSASK